jgi:hypothetical protein
VKCSSRHRCFLDDPFREILRVLNCKKIAAGNRYFGPHDGAAIEGSSGEDYLKVRPFAAVRTVSGERSGAAVPCRGHESSGSGL